MKVLLINYFDKLPGENFRDQRYTFLYEKLKQRVDVTWISSDFHHWSHKKRSTDDLPEEDRDNIVLINTIPYENNVSFRRFISHSIVSIKTFIFLIKSYKKYDTMLVIAPIENLFLSTVYSKITKTRLIIDILDLWPDLFEQAFPKNTSYIAKFFLFPFHIMANYSYKRADHITSVSKSYTEIAMNRGKRTDINNASFFYLGSLDLNRNYNINKSGKTLKCLFAGQFGHNYDIELLLKTAKKCVDKGLNIKFYLAGSGAKLEYIEQYILKHDLGNVELLGWLNSCQLAQFADECHVGLNSYRKFATQSVPTKIFDYMGFGLVVVNSLDGEIKEMIALDNSGFNYEAENVNSLFDLLNNLTTDINYLKIHGYNNYITFKTKYESNCIYDGMVDMILKGK